MNMGKKKEEGRDLRGKGGLHGWRMHERGTRAGMPKAKRFFPEATRNGRNNEPLMRYISGCKCAHGEKRGHFAVDSNAHLLQTLLQKWVSIFFSSLTPIAVRLELLSTLFL